MARFPMTAREQLQLAAEMGHELRVVTRTFPEHPDAPPKFYVSCSCGWEGKVVRSARGASSTAVWHMGRAIANGHEADQERRRNGA